MSGTRISIVGAGLGGLCAAVDLALAGAEVEVFERSSQIGGKARRVTVADREIDAGPTVLTMPWVFDELFARAGRSFREEVTLLAPELLARHAWADGSRLDLFLDLEQSAAAIEAFAGAREAEGYRAFMAEAQGIYQAVEDTFLRSQRPTLWGSFRSLGVRALGIAARVDARRTMWKALGTHFRDPRLRQLFGRYATYSGGSPFETPATFNLIAHVEQAGVWVPRGGISAVAEAVAGLARDLGVGVYTDAGVASVRTHQGRATGVVLESGQAIASDAVLLNADAGAVAAGLLGAEVQAAIPAQQPRSLSALTLAVVGEVRDFPLDFHNVFFSGDYAAEFEDLLAGRLPSEPTVYVCAQDRAPGEGGQEPAPRLTGAERMLMIINAPANGDQGGPLEEELDRCETEAYRLLERCGLNLPADGRASTRTGPLEWSRRFPGSSGALYGAAPHGMWASLRRPAAWTAVPGLYLCGGTAHPGAGVPMAALSGFLAAERIVADRPSSSFRPTAVTSGGTWTSSPTTGATAS